MYIYIYIYHAAPSVSLIRPPRQRRHHGALLGRTRPCRTAPADFIGGGADVPTAHPHGTTRPSAASREGGPRLYAGSDGGDGRSPAGAK